MLRTMFCAAAMLAAALPAQDAPEKVRVCATTPNLGAIVAAVAGEDTVELTVFAKPSQDPHHVVARPSYVRALHDADLLVHVGLDLEIAWLPALLEQARNTDVRPGGRGYLDASTVIRPLGIPERDVDRSEGDVHARGNPHFLLDPVRGAAVGDAIAERLGDLQPSHRETFSANAAQLRRALGELMVGAELASRYDFAKLAELARHAKLVPFLESQDEAEQLAGVLGRARPHRGECVIADHDAWPYVTDRLGLETIGWLEPKPGIPPSTRHLGDLVGQAREQHVRVLLTVPYFEQRAVEFIVENTDVAPVTLAHQAGAMPGTEDYVGLVRANFAAILDALERAPVPVR